jgi:predicted GNAT family acetyltransferase
MAVARTFPIAVSDDPSLGRYELMLDGRLAAIAVYLLVPGRIVFSHTELMAGFEGRGLGQQLASAVLDDVRKRGLTVIARCPFFSTFIEDHPDYGDLVDPLTAVSAVAIV